MQCTFQQKAYTRCLGIIFTCLSCFAQIVLCSTITGCSQSSNNTTQELVDASEQLATTKAKEQNTRAGITAMQAAIRGHQVRQRLDKDTNAATLIQALARKHLAHKSFAEKRKNAVLMQAAIRGHQLRVTAKKSTENLRSEAVVAMQVSRETDNQQAARKLGSADIRRFIKSQFMAYLRGLEESVDTFSSGGVEKATFFFHQDSGSRNKTYIALANDYDYQEANQSIKYIQSGEQSIAIVLSKIREHLEARYSDNGDTQILIPLQQLDKKHWTLLEIVLQSDNKSGGHTSITAQCYDSKGWVSGSNFADFWVTPQRIVYVKNCINEQFGVKTKWVREGNQGVIDDRNCGRHTLIKMGKLLRLKNAPKSIADINKVLAPGMPFDRQSMDTQYAQKKAHKPRKHNVATPRYMPDAMSEDWAMANEIFKK